MNILRYIAYTLPLVLIIGLPLVVGAQVPKDYLLVSDLPFVSELGENVGLAGYLSAIFRLGIGLAVTLAIVMIVYGGIQYMISDVPGVKVNAKGTIMNAIWGLVLVLASVLILNTINPDIVKFKLIESLKNAADSVQAPEGGGTPGGSGDTNNTTPDGIFDEDPGIGAQLQHTSSELSQLLSCMANTVPGNVGRLSSISDSLIISGQKTFEQCAAGECQHRRGSHHYGGTSCVGESYAVDFGDETNSAVLLRAAKECNPGVRGSIHNNNHVHISIGEVSGCGPGE